jgi:hypothetical protein
MSKKNNLKRRKNKRKKDGRMDEWIDNRKIGRRVIDR